MTSLTQAEAYRKYSDELVRFATGLVGPSDGPDLVANAMVNVLAMETWESVENPRAYLYTTVLNEARRNHRQTMRRRAVEMRAAISREASEPPEVRPDVLDAVARLSVRQRAVVFLAYWDDMRPAEIARRLSLSEGTVHRHLARGEARLRRMLHA
ncbi:MAG: RNA polymerase sigma factor [Acidimicrobiia bacterium]|nr:RNA polymerase sigma factor [Acidimicrobiia bacterium]